MLGIAGHGHDRRAQDRAAERRDAPLAWGVLLASVLEIVAPLVTLTGPGRSPGGGSGPDLLITPVGWAFAIWGVIYTLAVAQAVAVLVVGRGAVSRRLQVDLLTLDLGGTLWIVLAGLDSSLATAAALLLMLVAAVDGVLTVARQSTRPRRLLLLTRASVGLYAGWVTAAFFLNLSTALVDTGVVDTDTLPWQLGMLVAAVATLFVVMVATAGSSPTPQPAPGALIGIAVTGATEHTPPVTVLTLGAAVVLVGATVAVRVSGEHRADDPVRRAAPRSG